MTNFAAPQTNPFGLASVGNFADPILGDMTGDGVLDLFVGNSNGDIVYFQNTGNFFAAAFAAPQTNPNGLANVGASARVALGDIDRDGVLDLFVGNSNGDIVYFQNTGSATAPAFAAPQTNPFGLSNVGSSTAPSLADIDRDGDLDAFVGNNNGDILYFQNTGSATAPAFAAPQTNPFNLTNVGLSARPSFIDIDQDGDLDAFVGNKNGDIVYFQNTGSATAPAFAAPQTNPFSLSDVGGFTAPTFADIDRDGDLDAFVGAQDGNTYYFQNSDPVVLMLAETSASEAEPDGPVTGRFGVSLSQPATTTLTIPYTVSGSATPGTDYQPLSGIVTIPAGQNVAYIDVTPIIDNVFDPNETIVITLNPGAGYNLYPAHTDLMQIADQLPAVFTEVQISITLPAAPIGETIGRTEQVDIDADGDLDVFASTLSGNIYYSQNTGTFSAPSFSPYALNSFGISNVGPGLPPKFADIDGDGDLDAFVPAKNGVIYYYQNAGTASTPSFTAPQASPFNLPYLKYDNLFTGFGDVDNDGDLDAFISVPFGIGSYYLQNNGTASAADFSTPFHLPNNLIANQYFFGGQADLGKDGDLDTYLAGSSSLLYSENTPITVSIAAATTVPSEPGTAGTFTLTLNAPAPDDLNNFTVNYTIGGTATNGTDYANLTGAVSFARGATTATIDLTVTDDTAFEPGETVTLTLTDGVNYKAAASPANTATLTIEDNDIEYAIVGGTPTVTEGNSGSIPITYTITRTGRIDVASTVDLSLSGTATNGSDYNNIVASGTGVTFSGSTISFDAGATTATLTIDVVGDTIAEGNEDLTVALSNPTAATGFSARVPVPTPITSTITDDDPEIQVLDGTADIADGTTAALDFGNTLIGTAVTKTFTINNTGTAALSLSNLALPNGFSVVGQLPASIAAGSSATLTVQLDAAAAGTYNGTLQFSSDDSDENPFDFAISGTVTPQPVPEIQVLEGTIDIADGSTTALDFGSTVLGTTVTKTFTINNIGTAALNLSNLTLPTGFSSVGSLPATIAAGSQGTLTIQLDAAAAGSYLGTLQFVSDDSDENPFDFAISGTVTPQPVPEIQVLEGTIDIADGSTTALDFGSTLVGTTVTKTFTINNIGTAALNLSNLTLPTGFSSVGSLPATIAAGSQGTLTIQLDAAAAGSYLGTLQFVSDDSDENPFDFAISGTVTPQPVPEIQVLEGTIDIADGSTTALDFGSTLVGTTVTKTFTINNIGTAALNLSNLTLPTGFSSVGSLPATIAAGSQGTLTIQLDAAAAGSYLGTLQFVSDDSDENPFDFAISGSVTPQKAPEIQVLQDTTDIADGSTTALDFGSTLVGTTVTKTFTINNIGTAILQLGQLQLPAGFSLVGALPASVAAGASSTFQLQLDAAAAGNYNGTLSFVTSDADENPFEFAIAGTVSATPAPTPNPAPTPTPNPTTPDATDSGCLCDIFPTPALGEIVLFPNQIAETLAGTEGDELVIGDATAEAFNLKGGNDIVTGEGGSDNLFGGASIDLLFGNTGNDYIDGGAQNDIIFAGKDNDAVNGGADNDTVLGDNADDTLLGGDGNDWLFGNRGTDTIDGEGGDDIIFGGKNNDALLGNIGNDIVVGDLGDDLLKGSDGNDLLFGNVGADFVAGGAGDDTIFGGKDDDIVKGGEDNDIVVGDMGNDSICGGEGNDVLYGNVGDDSIDGCEGDDTLYGGKDDDTLIGNKGNDVLNGDAGNDSLVGGTGSDRFVLILNGGSDIVADFEDGSDKLVLAGGLSFEQLSVTSNGSVINIAFASTGELFATLNNVPSSLITAEDFVLI